MKRRFRRFLECCCLFALSTSIFSSLANAGTVHGTVRNGTTGKAGAGVEIVLIQLQGGMQPVANTKTDAQGNFSFDNPSIGAQPMLIRAVYQGVNFHQPLTPGKSEVAVEVFEPTQDPKSIQIASRIVIFQPNGSNLIVGEEYAIENSVKPPQAYFRADGNFDFALPADATLQQAAAWGPSGMPVVQATIDRGKNKHAIAFAFRPGENGVRYSYEVPYSRDSASLKLPTVYSSEKLIVVAPPGVQVSLDGLQPAGQEQGMDVYTHAGVAAGTTVALEVSGRPLAASGGADGGASAQDSASDARGANVQPVPGRLDSLKWPIVAVLAIAFAAFAYILARKPVVAPAGAPPTVADLPPSRSGPDQSAPSPSASSTLSALDASASASLDSLKDLIFRLELRRQAGTISEDEYAKERARAESILRDLVRG